MWTYPRYARSPSPSHRPTPTTIASRSPFPLSLCSCSTSLSKMGARRPRSTKGNGDIIETRFILCIIPTLLVSLFFFNSRNLATGILQTGPNQFVENQFVESSLEKKVLQTGPHFSTNWILRTSFLQTSSTPLLRLAFLG